MKILTIIPARGGSKGVPGKNIKFLGGKPLIAYTIESALQAGLEPIVNSDDDEILSMAKKHGAITFKRPAGLATDSARSIDVVIDMLKSFADIETILLLQATYPFRQKGMINEAIEVYKNKNLDSLISVLPVPDHYNPHWVFEAKEGGQLNIATGEDVIIPRRQELPPAYFRDGAIYMTNREILEKKQSFFGNSLGYIKSEWENYVNIDTMVDWEKAEDMARKRSTPDGNG